jgi:hypothetical protein
MAESGLYLTTCPDEEFSYMKKQQRPPVKPKPEEEETMPRHQHCPHAKHHGDRNPKYHMKSNRKTLHEFSPHICCK